MPCASRDASAGRRTSHGGAQARRWAGHDVSTVSNEVHRYGTRRTVVRSSPVDLPDYRGWPRYSSTSLSLAFRVASRPARSGVRGPRGGGTERAHVRTTISPALAVGSVAVLHACRAAPLDHQSRSGGRPAADGVWRRLLSSGSRRRLRYASGQRAGQRQIQQAAPPQEGPRTQRQYKCVR